LEDAGEVRLDDLSGISDYRLFCQMSNKEYDPATDKGVGTTFWDGKNSAPECAQRVSTLKHAFEMKYPNMPTSLREAKCDWWR
jgi:hypothetical protein